MRALVTGGSGFIGSHVVRALLSRGWDVRVLHIPGDPLLMLDGLSVEKIAGDIVDRDVVIKAVEGCDWVFHLAAIFALWMKNPERLWQVNVEGTRHVMEASVLCGVKRVVHTSSIAVYGGQGLEHDATEESPFALGRTGDLYSISKYAAHQVALSFAGHGLDVVVVAPTGPIGPGDIGPTPTGRLLCMGQQSPIGFVADTISNFGDVRDIAEGHVLAAERGKTGECYLLGTSNVHARELQRMVHQTMGIKKPVVSLPRTLLSVLSEGMVQVSEHVSGKAPLFTPATIRIARMGLRADCRKAVRELNLPQNPIERAVADAMQWFGQNQPKKRMFSMFRQPVN